VDEPSLLTSWTFDPLQLAPVALVALAYGLRVRTLRRRGTPPPTWRVTLFALGVALLVLAFASPIAAIGERELFSFHMLQHVVLGDLAPLCLLAGLTGPILRPVLALRPIDRLRVLANPAIALPVWAANLYLWHVPFLYEAAVRHSTVHALEHVCFFTAGLIMWLPVLETLPAPEWFGTGAKLGYIAVVRLVETLLGNVLLWSGSVFYPVYATGGELWGVSAERDQSLAGAVMMLEGSLVTIAALAWLFLRLAAEGELRQELLERGLDPRTVRRAVRYGRAQELVDRR
jgi:putative membrane protein